MALEELIATVGLPAIGVGVALEGEGVAFLGGVLAHRGLFPVEIVALVAALAAAFSDNVSFAAGRFAGRSELVQRVLSSGVIGRLRSAFDARPAAFTFGFRFLYGARVASAMLIGTTEVTWRLFIVIDLLSSLFWAHIYVWLGYAGSAAIEGLFGRLELHRHLLVALAVALVVAVMALLVRRHLTRRALPAADAGG